MEPSSGARSILELICPVFESMLNFALSSSFRKEYCSFALAPLSLSTARTRTMGSPKIYNNNNNDNNDLFDQNIH